MKLASILTMFCAFTLFGRSGDPYDKYIGYWERKDVEHHEVLQVSRDGETYLMNDNILRETDIFGKPKKSDCIEKI